MNKTALILITSFVFWSCSNFKFDDISKYNLKNQLALKNHSVVKVLCTHGGKDLKNNKEYYYQTIVMDKLTEDTITILTEDILPFDMMDMDKIEFISAYSKEKSDLLILAIKDKSDISKIKNINQLEPKKYTPLKKVCVNKKMDDFDGTKYPAVIGVLTQSENY